MFYNSAHNTSEKFLIKAKPASLIDLAITAVTLTTLALRL